MPVEMAGNATVFAPSSSATRSDSRWQDASSSERSSSPDHTGPTALSVYPPLIMLTNTTIEWYDNSSGQG
ncbi:hypothetical protein GCM10010507_38070 [Streptomyces cinnamoneus]|uniref:Uncharacterized protein n=1 Tax=Streptomyces cinnamoneus TaxID=53446 RepID=A0A918TSF3_STRCJ|nr:hypothetical protein GCM10010507_38070 [Streptomyces cinnamoneus]